MLLAFVDLHDADVSVSKAADVRAGFGCQGRGGQRPAHVVLPQCPSLRVRPGDVGVQQIDGLRRISVGERLLEGMVSIDDGLNLGGHNRDRAGGCQKERSRPDGARDEDEPGH